MDDTTLTKEKLKDLVDGWFDWFYNDEFIDLDQAIAALTAELHPAQVREILNLTGKRSLRDVLESYIEFPNEQGEPTN